MGWFLGFQGLVWTIYGAICLFYPQLLSTLAGLEQAHWSAGAEVRSMYGGAQMAIGVFALVGWRYRREHGRSAMIFFALLFGGLSVARTGAILAAGQSFVVAFGQMPQSYNAGALLFFEIPMFVIAMWLCRSMTPKDGSADDEAN
jgi:hypothetical protein